MPLETIEHKRLYRQVADQPRALIDDGEFSPGSRLPPERQLAEKFGISRRPIREALIALEVEGGVRIRLGSGIYVAESPPTARPHVQGAQTEGSFEVLRAREVIEAAIASETALSASKQLASHFETGRTWGLAAVEHRLILERIAARDASGAGQLMRNHLQASAARYSQSFGGATERRPPCRGNSPPTTRTGGGEHPPRAKTREEDP